MADSSPNTSKGFTPKPNSLVSMKLHNYGGGGLNKKGLETKANTNQKYHFPHCHHFLLKWMKTVSYFNQRLQQCHLTRLQGGRKGSQVSCAGLRTASWGSGRRPRSQGSPSSLWSKWWRSGCGALWNHTRVWSPILQAFLLKTRTLRVT